MVKATGMEKSEGYAIRNRLIFRLLCTGRPKAYEIEVTEMYYIGSVRLVVNVLVM